MTATTSSHVAARVADMERTIGFYTEALGGHVAFDIPLPPEFISSIFEAPEGIEGRNVFMRVQDLGIEFYEFTPQSPIPPMDQATAGLTHFCLMVEDVLGTLAKVEAGGGRKLFPVRPMFNGNNFVYCADPDGHIFELIDATLEQCIAGVTSGGLPDITKDASKA